MAILQSDLKNKNVEVLRDEFQQLHLQKAKQQYNSRNKKITDFFSDIDLAKNRATLSRWKATENLDKYLIEFEANCIKSGVKVLWAINTQQAHEELATVISRHEIKKVFTTGGFLQDEILLDDFVAKNSSLQKLNLHNRKPTNLKSFIKDEDHSAFQANIFDNKTTSLLIQQANFIVADTGSVTLSEYAHQSSTNFIAAKNTIILAGIDQLLPSINDLELFLAMQGAYVSDNGMQLFNKIISSPMDDGSGGAEVYVLLIDNGRSNLLELELHRQSLYCIQCGACQAACPVMQSIGSANCNSVFSGPIGFAGLPYWKGQKEFSHLSYSSPLCGKCNDICPVKIDFKKSMLALRHETVKRKQNPQQEKLFYYIWKKTMLKRELLGWRKINTYKYAVDTVFLKSKSGLRSLPTSAPKSFNQQWRDKNGLK